jgi:hypothetical protein
MHSSIDAKMKYMKQDMKQDTNSHIEIDLESFVSKIMELLNIPRDLTSFEQTSNLEGVSSSNSQTFQSNPLHRDVHLPRVEVNKFYGLDPTSWVAKMEHYFSLHGITDELAKLLKYCNLE